LSARDLTKPCGRTDRSILVDGRYTTASDRARTEQVRASFAGSSDRRSEPLLAAIEGSLARIALSSRAARLLQWRGRAYI